MKKDLLTLLVTLFALTLSAGEVSEQEALQKAQQFLQGRTFQQKHLRRAASSPTFADGAFYVFNADGNQGYVLVSADDRTEAILGYADEGNIDMSRLPSNARVWLENYARQIKALTSEVSLSAPHRAPGSEVVKPLLTAKWDQEYPYNEQCPEAEDDDKNVIHTLTGCVATAMAQVMFYYQWPQKEVKGLEGYTTKKEPYLNVDELDPVTFDWKNMKAVYTGKENASDASVKAVSELIRYCGQSVEMNYSLDVSTTFLYAETLVSYFGFSETVNQLRRYGFSDDEWQKILYDEMVAKRPVLYSASNGSGGHQFVIDGYDGKGLFHVNWGWGGYSDGYFLINDLNPDAQSVTGGPSDNGYTNRQEAIIGIQKPAVGDVASQPYIYQDSEILTDDEKDIVSSRVFTRSSVSDNFPMVRLRGWFLYTGNYYPTVQRTWAIYQGDKCIQVYDGDSYIVEQKMSNDQLSVQHNILMGAGLKGTYQLRQVYRFSDTDTWKLPLNQDNGNILVAEITDTQLTLHDTGGYKENVKVNKMTLSGDYVVHRPMTATINWTKGKNSLQNETIFYLWFGGDAKPLAYRTSFIGKGETEDLVIAFKPSQDGEVSMFITSDYKGENVIFDYPGTVTIKDMKAQKLKPSFTCTDWKDNTLKSTTLQISAKFQNIGVNDYSDNVIFELVPVDADRKEAGKKQYVRKPLTLAVDATSSSMNVEFAGLTNGQQYKLSICYYTNEQKGKYFYSVATTDYFTVDSSTGINAVRPSSQITRPAYNLRGQRVSDNYRGLVIQNGKKYMKK